MIVKRVEDALVLPARAGGQITVQPLVFNRVLDVAAVAGWQIAQQADGGLLVLVTGAPGPQVVDELPRPLAEALAREGACAAYIRVQPVDTIPKSVSGKAPLIRAYRP